MTRRTTNYNIENIIKGDNPVFWVHVYKWCIQCLFLLNKIYVSYKNQNQLLSCLSDQALRSITLQGVVVLIFSNYPIRIKYLFDSVVDDWGFIFA